MLLAFPPFNLGLLVFVALVPWLVSLRSATGREAWRSGYGFGMVYGLGQLFWVAQLTARWVGSIWMGVIPWILSAVLFALYFGWVGVLIRHAWVRKWPWAIPLVWAGIEVARSLIPTFAFPYALVATPLWPYTALIQTAHFGSIYLVSAWVLLFNVIVSMWLTGEGYLQTRRYMAVALAIGAMSVAALGITDPTKPFVVTIGQPGVDMAFGTPEDQKAKLTRSIAAIVSHVDRDGTQLLVLPEGITGVPTMPPHPMFPLPSRCPVIFGGERGTDPVYQSAFALDGRRWQYEDKTRLVVFGEYVPGRTFLKSVIEGFRLPSIDLTPGTEGVKAFHFQDFVAGPVVCFESLFPDVSYRQALNGAQLLTVIGIDDWFMDGNAPDQLRGASVWRAVETGLPLVRSATQGYSLACDGKGRILAQAPLVVANRLRVIIPLPQGNGLFHALPVFPATCGVFALAFPWIRPRKRMDDVPADS